MSHLPDGSGPGDTELPRTELPRTESPRTESPRTEPTLPELHELVSDLLAWVSWEGRRGLRLVPAGDITGAPRATTTAARAGPAPTRPKLRPRAGSPPRAPAEGRARRAPAPAGPAPTDATPPRRSPARAAVPPARPAGSAATAPPPPADVKLSGTWARLARPGALIDGQAPAGSDLLRGQLDAAVGQADPAARLAGIRRAMGDCKRCGLCASRTHIAFGVGDPAARLVVLGEGPGEQEDLQGEPFVGAAGQMLDRMIENVLGLQRRDVYILNMVKCRPPRNRNPQPAELDACRPFLMAQLAAIRPDLVLLLGSVASRALLGPGIMRARGRWHALRWPGGESRVMATFHPAYLLRKPADKRLSFQDLKLLRSALDELGPRPA